VGRLPCVKGWVVSPNKAQPRTPVEKPDRPAVSPCRLAYTGSELFSTTQANLAEISPKLRVA